VWPSARYPYVQAAIDFLVDPFGFEATTLTLGEIEGHYAHVELRWPEGSGGIMIGSTDNTDGYRDQMDAGTTWLHEGPNRVPPMRNPGRLTTLE